MRDDVEMFEGEGRGEGEKRKDCWLSGIIYFT